MILFRPVKPTVFPATCALVLVLAVRIRDLQSVDLPMRGVLQQDSCPMFASGINTGLRGNSKRPDSDRIQIMPTPTTKMGAMRPTIE